jgi:hypothetical protein
MFRFEFTPRRRTLVDLSIIVLASIAIVLPILLNGIPNGNDLPQHYQFALDLEKSILDGVIHPGWSADPNNGYGDVGLRFYPPFSYYALISFRAIAGNWYHASVLAFSFWFILGSIGVYFWVREWFAEAASLIASLVFLVFPYHVNQIYNAFFYAEFAAAGILPFCFLFATRICSSRGWGNVLGLSLFYALLVLTHLPTAIMGSMALLIYSLVSLPKGDRCRSAVALAIGAIFGLILSSFYWIRIVFEVGMLSHAGPSYISQAYDFRSNLLFAYPIVSFTDYIDRSLWFGDLLLLITLLTIIPAAVLFFRTRKSVTRSPLVPVTVLLCTALFFATPLSLPIWENLGLLQKIQFPFRWMSIISLTGALFVGAGFAQLRGEIKTNRRPLALIAVGAVAICFVFSVTQVIRPSSFIDRGQFNGLLNGLASSKSCECWWPIWAKEEGLGVDERVTTEVRSIEVDQWSSLDRRFRVSAGDDAYARIATFYYPHWAAEIDGFPRAVEKDTNGVILIKLSRDDAEVRLHFREPAYVQVVRIISAAAWASLVAALLLLLIASSRRAKDL